MTADRWVLARCVLEESTYPTGLITISDDITENLPAMLYLAGYAVQNYVPAPGRPPQGPRQAQAHREN
ncbi:MAG: hypothetical protein ABSG73_07070 [Candidatus Aminicenantales bacterium]